MDQLRGLVDLEQAEVAPAGDVEQDAGGALDGLLQQRRARSPPWRPRRRATRRRRCRCPSAPSRRSAMIARTSAKSRLIRPGIVIRSVMPWTPWRRTLSASRNASRMLVRRSTIASSFSFGITISVSTISRRRSMPSCAWRAALRALEGERARDDADGQRADLVLGDLGDHRRGARAGAAALARGDEHHVRALERLLDVVARLGRGALADLRVRARAEALREGAPMCSLRSASVIWSACASVLAAMNSTPESPASIIRFTALVPPPPTPTTLMTAR